MKLLEYLMDLHKEVLTHIDTFISGYHNNDDSWRMPVFSEAMTELNNLMDLEWNIIFPRLKQVTDTIPNMDEARTKRQDIEYFRERLINIHVDEPDNQFFEISVELRDCFLSYSNAIKAVFSHFDSQNETQNKILNSVQHELFESFLKEKKTA